MIPVEYTLKRYYRILSTTIINSSKCAYIFEISTFYFIINVYKQELNRTTDHNKHKISDAFPTQPWIFHLAHLDNRFFCIYLMLRIDVCFCLKLGTCLRLGTITIHKKRSIFAVFLTLRSQATKIFNIIPVFISTEIWRRKIIEPCFRSLFCIIIRSKVILLLGFSSSTLKTQPSHSVHEL